MAKLHYSHSSIADLTDIWTYTLEKWSRRQADIYYNQLIAGCEAIVRGGVSGRNYDDVADNLHGFKVGRHIIFYRHAGGDIEIIRFLHESMDLKNRITE